MRFLRTKDIGAAVDRIIQDADHHVIIISPFLDPTDSTQRALQTAVRRGATITVIYGKKEKLKPEVTEFFETLDNCSVYFVPDLHAKCIANDTEAVISSMNLYGYSEAHNFEMGVALEEGPNDAKALKDLGRYFEDIMEEAKPVSWVPQYAAYQDQVSHKARRRKQSIPTRECACCGDIIPEVENQPLCPDCLRSLADGEMAPETWHDLSPRLRLDEELAIEFSQQLIEEGEKMRCISCAKAIPRRIDHRLCRGCYKAELTAYAAQESEDITAPDVGHCINCNTPIEFDPAKPLCRKCYFKARNGTCNYCHECGTKSRTRLKDPLCADCTAGF